MKFTFYYTFHYIDVKVQGNNTVFFPSYPPAQWRTILLYEANSRCGSREFSDVLQKPNIRHRLHNMPPLVPVLSPMNAVIPVAKQFSDAYIF
jgi:hypothetical protein